MFDIQYLKKQGVSDAEWKKYFTIEPAKRPKPLQRLYDLIRNDNIDGTTMNLREWRAHHAVDLAYGVPFNQTTPTLVHDILSRNLNAEQTLDALKDYGLSDQEMFMTVQTEGGKEAKQINAPLLFQIALPIVKSYVQTVLGQIFNERNRSPLLPYNPLKQTDRNRVACEIWTDIVQTISTWYGYPEVYKQAIEQMLKYGIMLAFPLEEWHVDYQIFDYGKGPEKVTMKEGIRYTIPHPSCMYYDLKFPLTTLNTDTGIEFMGHRRIMSYGQILDNKLYWNRKEIFAGTNWFKSPLAGNYFTEIFPCRFKFPHDHGFETRTDVLREDRAAWYRNANQRDDAVFVTEQFRKIIPVNYGLGNYKYPIWARFTLAGDDTVIYAAPCAFTPGWFMGYDYDQNTARTPSLALDLIPYQDHIGNILSQMVLTAKQNLDDTYFYDTNIINPTNIKQFQNLGERRYRSRNFIPFDSLNRRMAQVNQKDAIFPVQTQQRSINELQALIPTTLSIMERLLGIAAQEAGAQASHQQSKAEVSTVVGAGKNRRILTASSVDAAEDAWKRQLHAGYTNYGDGGVTAQVSADIDDLETHLKDMGFETLQKGDDKVLVRGRKTGLKLEGFAASNQGPQQPNEKEVAQAILQGVQTLLGQEDLHKEVGAKQLLKLIEQAVIMAGGPKDFRLQSQKKEANGKIDPAVQQAMNQLGQTLMQSVNEKVAKPAAQKAAQQEQEIQQIEQVVQQLKKIYDVAAAAQEKEQRLAAEAKQKMEIRDAEARADEKRKADLHQAEMQRLADKAHVEHTVKIEKAKADAQIDRAQAAHKIATTPAKPAKEKS